MGEYETVSDSEDNEIVLKNGKQNINMIFTISNPFEDEEDEEYDSEEDSDYETEDEDSEEYEDEDEDEDEKEVKNKKDKKTPRDFVEEEKTLLEFKNIVEEKLKSNK